jgi:hypothetical protein
MGGQLLANTRRQLVVGFQDVLEDFDVHDSP